MTAKNASTLTARRARDLRGSPLGNLLLEDAAASKQHGRTTARVGVGPDGNPIVYSTDVSTREAVVRAIQERAHVNFMDIPEVSEHDFRNLIRDGTAALDQPHDLALVDVSEGHAQPNPSPSVQPTNDAPFVLVVRHGRAVIHEAGPFERITEAIAARDEWDSSERGMVAAIYEGGPEPVNDRETPCG